MPQKLQGKLPSRRSEMCSCLLWLQITVEDACKLLKIKTGEFSGLRALPKTSQHSSSARDENGRIFVLNLPEDVFI